jgi:hypothetical protein
MRYRDYMVMFFCMPELAVVAFIVAMIAIAVATAIVGMGEL